MKRLEHGPDTFIFNSRRLLATFYLGLVLAIGLLLVQFIKSFLASPPVAFGASGGDAI